MKAKAPDWRKLKKSDPKFLVKAGAIGIELRNLRKSLEQEAAKLKHEQDSLEDFLIGAFDKADLKQVKTRAGVITLSEKVVPRAADWDQIYKYIKNTGEFDLLQRRLGEKACQERWERGEAVPGVEKYHDKRIKFGED